MTEGQRFEEFIALCQRIYDRMAREETWPWPEEPGDEPQLSGGDITK